MTLLNKHNNIGLSVWDTKSLINNRNIIPDFHSFNNHQSFQTKNFKVEFFKDSKFNIESDSGLDLYKYYKPLNIKSIYKVFDHILHSTNHYPKENDKIICNIQRRIIKPFLIDEMMTELPIKSNVLAIVCINQVNIKSNVYRFITEDNNEIKKDLSPNFMFILEKKVKDKQNITLIPSELVLEKMNHEGIEDLLLISYFIDDNNEDK